MYDLNNDTAGLERHKQMIKEAEEVRRTRKVAGKRNMLTQVRTALIKSLSVIIR